MAEVKNIQQRDEFHRAIGTIADDLSDSVAMFRILRTYVLGTMYYRYLSELFTALCDECVHHCDGDADFSYAESDDDDVDRTLVEDVYSTIGNSFGITLKLMPSDLFCNVCKRADKEPDLNQTLKMIFMNIHWGCKDSDLGQCFSDLLCCFNMNDRRRRRFVVDDVANRNKSLVKLLWVVRDLKLDPVDNINAFRDVYNRRGVSLNVDYGGGLLP